MHHHHETAAPRSAPPADIETPGPTWQDRVFTLGLTGSLLMFAALPPLGISFLGWIAPVPWLLIAGRPRFRVRRPYLRLWLAGLLFWLAALAWLRIPHPALTLGWLALGCYLGCYLPLFILLTRSRLRVPLYLAAPIVWTGLEWLRSWLLTGFLMASLAHTQVEHLRLIQISDLGGEFAVDFLMVLVAAAIACGIEAAQPGNGPASRRWRNAFLPAAIAAVALAAAVLYGDYRLSEPLEAAGPRVALIQGTSPADWKRDPQRQRRIMAQYSELSYQAVKEAQADDGRRLDLIVWPETMFRAALYRFSDAYLESPHASAWPSPPREYDQAARQSIKTLAEYTGTPLMLGIDSVSYDITATGDVESRAYNAVILTDRDGSIRDRYAKVHLVVFGEYVPFSSWWPALAKLSPLTGMATAGSGPVAMQSGGVVYAPSVCYESVLPRVIRGHVRQLISSGTRPQVLVNVTNDAWYLDSAALDMHLACDVFRAIENRLPMLVAANGGISASINSCGRIVKRAPKQKPTVVIADVELDSRGSLYVRYGDWLGLSCLAFCLLAAVTSAAAKRRPSV